MSRVRVYLTPFQDDGTYGTEIEVTKDVLKIGKIKRQLDNSEYDIGIFRNSSVTVSLRNDHGKYSDVGNLRSVFHFKRDLSKVRITWDFAEDDLVVGFFSASYNTPLPNETNVFLGLISDTEIKTDVGVQNVDFKCLGYESLIDIATVPFSSISNGDDLSEVIFKCLNQSSITSLLTVAQINLSVGQDVTVDDKSSLENDTVKDALKNILFASNSVLYLDGTTVKSGARTASAAVQYTFRGHGSETPSKQTVLDIKNHRDGSHRIFNHWTWADVPSLVSQDTSSKTTYGTRAKEIKLDIITDTTKRQSLLDANKNEFRNPKVEFDLTGILGYDTMALKLLDRVIVDYPSSFEPFETASGAYYGSAIYGVDRYWVGDYSLSIDSADEFKIMSIEYDLMADTCMFHLREV